MRLLLNIVIAATVMGSANVLADAQADRAGKLDTRQFTACMKSATATVDEHNCLADEEMRQDAVLNYEYGQVITRLDASQRLQLRNDERAWIKRRDKTCNDAGKEYDGGSFAPLAMDGCAITQTELRIIYLRAFGSHGR